MRQGQCHKCNAWVVVEGVKDIDVKVRATSLLGAVVLTGASKIIETFWWKHAAQCHDAARIEGEEDFFEE